MLAVGGCSFFSTEPDAGMVRDVHKAAPRGVLMDTAESDLGGLGFTCSYRQGEYEDEAGATRSAPHFLLCERRPGAFSFNCENRDHVVVLPSSTGTVDTVNVSRGPSCSPP
jgi:hypothetical protein